MIFYRLPLPLHLKNIVFLYPSTLPSTLFFILYYIIRYVYIHNIKKSGRSGGYGGYFGKKKKKL